MRVPNTFFLSLAWWLAGSRKRCLGRACEKAEPQQVLCPSHCETAAEKMPKRRCWSPLERKIYIYAQPMRNRSQKTAETLLLEPTALLRRLFFFVFSRFQKQRFGSFLAAVSHGLALFLAAVSHGLGIIFLLSNGFQQRRFGIFPATVSQWLGHKTCCASQTPFS